MVAPRMPIGYWPQAPVYERDVAHAKALLAQAGAQGLSLQLDYSTDPQADLVTQIIQSNLREVGISITLNKVDSATYYVASPSTIKRELSYTWLAGPPDPFFYCGYFTCAGVNQWNWAHRCDPTFDRLVTEASGERNKTARQNLYVEIQKRWDAACSDLWVAWETNYFRFEEGADAVDHVGREPPTAVLRLARREIRG